MKHIFLIVSLFVCIPHTTHTMKIYIPQEYFNNLPAPLQTCLRGIVDNNKEQFHEGLLLGVDINYNIKDGITLLHMACLGAKEDIALELLNQKNIDPSICCKDGTTALHMACRAGLTKVVDLLTQDNTTINNQNYYGDTPLHHACCGTIISAEVIKLLLEKDANPTIQDNNQQTPLCTLFCNHEDIEILNFLAHSDPYISEQLIHATDEHNNTQLHLCAAIPVKDQYEIDLHQKYLLLLSAKGLDITAQNNDGKTAIDLADQAFEELRNQLGEELLPYLMQPLKNQMHIVQNFFRLTKADPQEVDAMLDCLTEQSDNEKTDKKEPKVSYNLTNYNELSLAQRTCLTGVEDNALILVQAAMLLGTDLNFNNQYGEPLLSLACNRATDEIVKQLLTHPTINIIAMHTRFGDTPLHNACKANRPTIVKLLLDKDPTTVTIENSRGQTPFHIAITLKDATCLQLILQKDPELANTVINNYYNNNNTPLQIAAKTLSIKHIQLLLAAHNKNINHQNDTNNTALHLTCTYEGHKIDKAFDIIKLLIVNGADTTRKNDLQQTAPALLFSSLYRWDTPLPFGFFETFNFYLTQHPDIVDEFIRATDKHKNSQFHLCTQVQSIYPTFEPYLSLLASHGLDIYAKNEDGKTATELASQAYNKLYNRYKTKKFPYIKSALDTQEQIMHGFLRHISARTPCAEFKALLKQKSSDGFKLPKDVIPQIIDNYYALNIETIVAKKYKNKEYYEDFIENKHKIRQQLLNNPEPQLLWSA